MKPQSVVFAVTKITESARGEECLIRTPVCNGDPATTVFCHLPGAGMGRKYIVEGCDIGAYGCSDCHDLVDGRSHFGQPWARDMLRLYHLEGTIHTLEKLLEKGLVTPE